MKNKMKEIEGGSFIKGELPKGCKLCRKGAQLFFLVTGKCCENCFYCSLNLARRNEDIILANERPITSFSGVMLEVSNMNALGAAITGGDPLYVMDRTLDYIKKMKQEFGKKFYIHLYTSGRFATEENLSKLYKAGLDEIRFHPQNKGQEKSIETASNFSWNVGAEIPVIPEKKNEIMKFLDYLEGLENVKFCNLNELEATEANFETLKKLKFELKSKDSSAIAGSEVVAIEILEETDLKLSLHYCSSLTKDAIQFRNRLKRTAKIVKKPYEEIQDGMLIKAIIKIPKYLIVEEIQEAIIDEFNIEPEMIALREDKNLETSWIIAEELKDFLFEHFEVEDIIFTYEYPTFGRTVIAQSSLKDINAFTND